MNGLLLETGDALLQENADAVLLEQQGSGGCSGGTRGGGALVR